jgi:carboxymethylenebutenolidase
MGVQGEMIEIGGMPAWVARPDGSGPWPAVLVIQEAFGLNEHIKDVARRVAAEGYVALAPDLFHRGGKGRTAGYDQLPKALELMGALKDDEIVADVASAIAYLEKQPTVRAGRIGITGFCMGGRVAYLVACALPEKIAAAVPYYGGGIPVDRTATLRAPVLAFFGDDDPFIPMDHVEKLRAEAKRLGKDVEIVVYPKAPHGFFCNERESYRPEAARDAWEKTTAFFRRHLQA